MRFQELLERRGVRVALGSGAVMLYPQERKKESEVPQSCLTVTPWTVAYQASLLCPWDSPGKNTGVGYHFLLQGIFLTQGSNPSLPHWRQTLQPLSH